MHTTSFAEKLTPEIFLILSINVNDFTLPLRKFLYKNARLSSTSKILENAESTDNNKPE